MMKITGIVIFRTTMILLILTKKKTYLFKKSVLSIYSEAKQYIEQIIFPSPAICSLKLHTIL